jgi:chitin disaccharide deacetylase
MGTSRVKRLIVTADDFGASLAVNEAVEDAHRRGILSAASLMVAGDAAEDAVARARRLPRLGVGLHLVLVDGRPVSPAAALSELVGEDGRFPNDPLRIGLKLAFRHAARRQAEHEVRAQLAAFRATGLALDHVNAHHHLHFHPAVREMLLRLAAEFGIRAMRVPREPALLTWRIARDRGGARLANKLMLGALSARLAARLDRAGVAHNDWQLGLSDTGALDAARLRKFLAALPDGVTELYLHPSLEDGRAEYQALIDPEVVALLKDRGIAPVAFAAPLTS